MIEEHQKKYYTGFSSNPITFAAKKL